MPTPNDEKLPEGAEESQLPQGSHIDGDRLVSNFDEVIDSVVKDHNIQLASDVVEDKKPEGEGAEIESEKTVEENTGGDAQAEEPKEEKKVEESSSEEPKAEEKATGRDDDIEEIRKQLEPHTKPATKKHFEAVAQRASEARSRAEAAERERDELKQRLEEAAKAGVPKEVNDELERLREAIREIDVERDPTLKTKYDAKIGKNEDKVVGILRRHGYGTTEDGQEIPGKIDELKRNGINRKNLESQIKALEQAGEIEDAEELRDILRENHNLNNQKREEISQLKATYGERKTQSEQQMAQELEAANKRMTEVFQKEVNKFDFLKEPPKVDPKDAPGVRKAKEQAQAAHNEMALKFGEAVKKETTNNTDAHILARVGILYRDHVVPNYIKQMEALKKENESLRGQMKGLKGASDVGKIGAGKIRPAARQEIAPGTEDFDSAVDAAARAAGLIK